MEHVQCIRVLQHYAHNYAYRANTLLNCPRLLNRPRVVQTLDSAIHWINHYPVDRC